MPYHTESEYFSSRAGEEEEGSCTEEGADEDGNFVGLAGEAGSRELAMGLKDMEEEESVLLKKMDPLPETVKDDLRRTIIE